MSRYVAEAPYIDVVAPGRVRAHTRAAPIIIIYFRIGCVCVRVCVCRR